MPLDNKTGTPPQSGLTPKPNRQPKSGQSLFIVTVSLGSCADSPRVAQPKVPACVQAAVGERRDCVVTIDSSQGLEVRVSRFGLSGSGGVLWFVAGGPGDSAVDLFVDDPSETLSSKVLSGYRELIVADVRGVAAPRPVRCAFESGITVLLATQLEADCGGDAVLAATMHAGQVADDLVVVAKELSVTEDVTVLAVSWGASVGIALMSLAPPWLKAMKFDSPSFVLSRPQSVATSVQVLRDRVVMEGVSDAALWVSSQADSVEERQRFELYVVTALDKPGGIEELLRSYEMKDIGTTRRATQFVRSVTVPGAGYVPFLCSEIIPQRISGDPLLGAYESLRATPRTCKGAPVPERGLPRVQTPQNGKVRVDVTCSSADYRAPVEGCNWLAMQYGVKTNIVPGATHVLSTS
jgi:pimeloyl-ACP methyl ester carboxylesterase